MEIEIIFNYGTVVMDIQIFEESKNSTISNCSIIIKILLRFSLINNIIMEWSSRWSILDFADHWSYNLD